MTRASGPWRPPARPEQSGAPAEPGSPTDPAAPPPEEIHTAWVLWLAAAAFGLVGMLLNAATASFSDLPAATRDAFRDAVADTGAVDISVEDMFSISLAVGAVVALLAAAVTVWLAFRLRAGKGWARTMLDIVAVFLIVDAVSVIVGVFGGVAVAGDRGDVVSFIVIALQILAGLCAATAVWRQHTAEAMKFTTPGGGARAGK
ncbi:hypothetical protein [Dietzia cinnamea]|uniref:Uncharacterized protein n=1 Tax=Dietzia cinnamea TaxID=321318 RepID=A0A4R3ZWS9_9ACTN|nr:hypothetical protein [Dietzia cinnamea]TCW25010.1 hypothetical protein EDD19_10568 [Dietzia cinnamea]